MSGKALPLEGDRFGQLLVLNRIGSDKHGQSTWLCKCDCGTEIITTRSKLIVGDIKTCGNKNSHYHIERRLNEKTIKTDTCWIWTGSCNGYGEKGYGIMMANGKHQVVHRIRYELVYGKIPDNMYVLHTCDNRKCTNPDHLWLGTYQDNAIDMYKKKRNYDMSGEGNGRAKLTQDIVDEIRNTYTKGKSKEFSIKYNISESTIHSIMKNETWKQ